MLDVMVFTAHRRGEYLVDRLTEMDIRFQTFDFSNHLGERDEKDLLGPFGLFDGEPWKKEHRRWLEDHYVFAKQKQGWAVYSDQGTLEANGLVSGYQKTVMKDWSTSVAMSLYSSLDFPLRTLKEQSLFCDFFSPYYLPWALENPKVKLMDVGLEFLFESQPGLKKLTFQNTTYSSPFVMNFLSGSELMALGGGLPKLVPGEVLRPRQSWQRAEILLSAEVDLNIVPLQILMATKLDEPWLEDRFFILQRQENEGYYSLWYRTWYERHKSPEHFKSVSGHMEQAIVERIPGAKVQWLKTPVETEEEKSFSLFPIFDQKEWTLQNKWLENGVYNGSPDKLPNYLWSQNMSHQESLAQHFSQEYKK
jgi:hypothetical protein